jgi:hypothetical protein
MENLKIMMDWALENLKIMMHWAFVGNSEQFSEKVIETCGLNHFKTKAQY